MDFNYLYHSRPLRDISTPIMREEMESTSIPIDGEESWEAIYSIPIEDTGERITPLSLVPERFLVRSHYFELGMPDALSECYARSGVLDLLLKASSLLPDNLRLVVLDAWRSEQLQIHLFQQCQSVLAELYPELSKETLNTMTQQYVAPPKNDPLTPPPHFTGGAVDLMIATRDGVPLFFGSPFDDPNEISYTRHFERKLEEGQTLSSSEETALRNRRLLFHVMTKAGFVNFSSEWWHFEYGTQRWASKTGEKNAIYSGITVSRHPFDEIRMRYR